MGMLKEFREFALKGNMIDMAVGIIIGAAFSGVVTSLVNDIVSPALGVVTGGVDFSDKSLTLSKAEGDKPGLQLAWGRFVQTCFEFLIKAWALFLLVKAINTAKRQFEREQAAAPAKASSPELQVLTEIRDALRK